MQNSFHPNTFDEFIKKIFKIKELVLILHNLLLFHWGADEI